MQDARGNAGKRRTIPTPEAPGGMIVPLEEVAADPFAKQEWDHIIGDLARMQIARPLYATTLSLYCIVVGKLRKTIQQLGTEEIVLLGKQGLKLNPKFDLVYKLMTRFLPLATECGLTPASTRRLHAPELPPRDEAEMEQEFFGAGEEG